MKLFSVSQELKTLRTITSTKVPDELKARLFGVLEESHFHHPASLAAYQRLMTIAKKRSRILSFNDLCEDPALSEDFRDILKNSEPRTCRTHEAVEEMFHSIDSYRKTRVLYSMFKTGLEQLKAEKVDVDTLLDKCTNDLTHARITKDQKDAIKVIGLDNNTSDLVKEVLYGDADPMYKCGFKDIDERNGGIPREGVAVLSATTSGGKSALLMQLLINIHMLNEEDVVTISLEMSERQLMRRLMANRSKIHFSKFIKRQLEDKEKRTAKEAYKEFRSWGREHKCRYGFYCPNHGLTMQQALLMMRPYGYKVIAIDYMSLLEGMDSDAQWRLMGEAVRQAKIFSRENHCLIILLAQLDSEEDRIRYSRAIVEHADLYLNWNYSKTEQRESRILPIRIGKARDQEIFNFELKEMFDIMAVGNLDDDDGTGPLGEEKDSEVDLSDEADINYAEDAVS